MSTKKIEVQILEGKNNRLNLAQLQDVLIRKLIIPSYQRPYTWEVDDIKEIFKTIGSTKEDGEDICFFGSIIISQKIKGYGQEEYYIIDGQQRITSFLLLIRIFLNSLNELIEHMKKIQTGISRSLIELENKKEDLEKIIKSVSLKRDQPFESSKENHTLQFIKKENQPVTNKSLNEIITNTYDFCFDILNLDIKYKPELKDIEKHTKDFLDILDFILEKIKFCLISIEGEENVENFAVNLFNTLNTTGKPLTAFEVLKSELYTISEDLSKRINKLQSDITRTYSTNRKQIISHTGKLLLYLPLYRGDFNEDGYVLSDKKFKEQRSYLKSVLNKESASQLVTDIEVINEFYSKHWLKLDELSEFLKNKDEQLCFNFLSELKHDRVLPIIVKFYIQKRDLIGECVKMCVAFSSLWRAFNDGKTSGIDKTYKDISLDLKEVKIQNLNTKLKELFFKQLSVDNLKELKKQWMQKMERSTIYKNQKLSKFLLFVAFNQKHFDDGGNSLKKGKGINILDLHYWKDKDYKTIEHIIPKSDNNFISHVHTIGNLTLLPMKLNSSLGKKTFSQKNEDYKKFCSTEKEDSYPYLPLIKHISHYDKFNKKEIEERSQVLSEFIWQTLAEDWLKWKD